MKTKLPKSGRDLNKCKRFNFVRFFFIIINLKSIFKKIYFLYKKILHNWTVIDI